MNLLNASVSLDLALLGWILFVPAVLLALRDVRDGFLTQGAQQHAWLAGLVCVALLWTLPVKMGDGPAFGMLGVALYVLLFGRARAVLGLLGALLLHTWLADGAWMSLGLNGLLFAVLPALIASTLQRALERWLPKNVFVFIIGNGMFVTLAATAITSLALLALSMNATAAAATTHYSDYVGYSLLLAWGEALLSGMIFSALVIFLPQVVLTYREDSYLPPRRSRL
jgi:uncharacterized membrane protein